ncbi:MAG: hypothetical protein H6732_04800 [Alphaproteobacteria bacterium]|nr:hypothetical protein [Alphaproteobacteria bacterium]
MTASPTPHPGDLQRAVGPTWLARQPRAHHPVILRFPRAEGWLVVARRQGCIHRGVAWLPVGDLVAALPLTAPVEVLADGPRLLLLDAAGLHVRVQDGALTLDAARTVRVGLDVQATRQAARWSVPGLDLPDGATRSARLRPFATGHGAAWVDLGWVYRREADRPVEVLGPLGPEGSLLVGPQGVALTGDGHAWTAVAAPRRALQHLEAPLRPGSLRFDEDGTHLAGLTDEGEPVRLDARTGRVVRAWEEGRPLTSRRPATADAPSEAGRALADTTPGHEGPGRPAPPPWCHLGADAVADLDEGAVAWSADGLRVALPTRP